jgi:hypothetical protein
MNCVTVYFLFSCCYYYSRSLALTIRLFHARLIVAQLPRIPRLIYETRRFIALFTEQAIGHCKRLNKEHVVVCDCAVGELRILRLLRTNFYVLLTVHLSVILDNDQLDTHLLYFTILLL